MPYFDGINETRDADTAAIAAQVSAATSATAGAQSASGRYIVEYGAEVLPGHADVTGPAGEPPDSDVSGSDASDV